MATAGFAGHVYSGYKMTGVYPFKNSQLRPRDYKQSAMTTVVKGMLIEANNEQSRWLDRYKKNNNMFNSYRQSVVGVVKYDLHKR